MEESSGDPKHQRTARNTLTVMAKPGGPSDRSFAPFTDEHLKRLARIALEDQQALLERKPHLKVYADRLLLIALCQGGALHYVTGKCGVKDLDVYLFYAAHRKVNWPYRRHGTADFGESEFGYRPKDKLYMGRRFVGRHVDIMGRSFPVSVDADPLATVRDWLEHSRNKTPRLLKEKAVVGLYPRKYRGKVMWPD